MTFMRLLTLLSLFTLDFTLNGAARPDRNARAETDVTMTSWIVPHCTEVGGRKCPKTLIELSLEYHNDLMALLSSQNPRKSLFCHAELPIEHVSRVKGPAEGPGHRSVMRNRSLANNSQRLRK